MNEQAFILENQSFLWYSKAVWPLHRLWARRLLSPRCSRCAISSKCVPLGADGQCDACRTYQDPKSTGPSQAQIKLLRDVLENAQGKGKKQYDALVMFSGGMNSTYLVHRLQEDFPKLRMLLLTVDNSFMSPVALSNIVYGVAQLGVPHMTVSPPPAFYDKMFRYAFLHLNDKGCSVTVDQLDGDFLHDVGRFKAVQRDIPFVISGCSKMKVERILGLSSFESPKAFETSRRTHVAGLSLDAMFTLDDRLNWWNGTSVPDEHIPRVLYPFYAWDLPEDQIKKEVLAAKLLKSDLNNPLLTSMPLYPLMTLVDYAHLGYGSFEPGLCEMIRHGKARKVFWRNIFEMTEYAARKGRLISRSVDPALDRLGLTRDRMQIPR